MNQTLLDLSMFTRRRLRPIRQSEVAECGLACLAMITSYYRLDVDIGTLRRRFPTSPRGASLQSLMEIADAVGLIPRAVRLPLDGLSQLRLPAILHWDLNHYVVLQEVRRGRALIHDPVGRSDWRDIGDVSAHFTGVALELAPGEHFQPGVFNAQLRLRQLWQGMSGLKRAMAQVALLSLIMQTYIIALPYYTQIAIDSILPSNDERILVLLAIGFSLFTVLNVGASLMRSFVLQTAGATLGFGISTNLTRKLFRLPISWFERRSVGDVISRYQSITPIQKLLAEGAVAALVDGLLAIITLGALFLYSTTLSLISLTAFVVYLLARWVSFSFQRDAQDTSIISHAREQTTLIESIRGIVTLRLFARETMRHATWQSQFADVVNADVRLGRITIWQQSANLLIFGLENVVSIAVAVGLVMHGGFSIGMVFAFMAYKTQFLQRGAALIDQAVTFRMIRLHLQRLADIALAEQDRGTALPNMREQPYAGALELQHIQYQYGPTDPFVLKGVDIRLNPGDHVAITGPSGGGKSTLVKIILGLIEPSSGKVLIDGIPIEHFGHRNYYRQIAAVLQDDSLFAGSLAENIALFDDDPDEHMIFEAARAAAIHDDILAMPMRYDTLVGDMGSTLSGGQKQRVLLARALYRKPKLLVLDEGTAHLDSEHERAVNRSIATAGITRIIIAHRRETIANADKIYCLDAGKLSVIDKAAYV